MIEDSFWDQVAENGWAVTEPVGVDWPGWSRHVDALFASRGLRDARIGRATGLRTAKAIRGDHIAWLREEDSSVDAEAAAEWLDRLRRQANESLRTGLRWCEAHWALYPPGEGYDWHLDQHPGRGHRRLTFVYYLNENWSDEFGGEIEMRLSPDSPRAGDESRETGHRITPSGGKLLIFRSDLFPHRVLPAVRARKSLTGWFRDDDEP